jgi:hypothetical protein
VTIRALYLIVVGVRAHIVFLDENNCVKLGDFGLSKALAQTSFANTYVGVGINHPVPLQNS